MKVISSVQDKLTKLFLPKEETDKKEKLFRFLVVANAILIILLVIFLAVKIYNKVNSRNISGVDVETSTQAAEKKLNDSMSNLYKSLLAGSTGISYALDDNTVFTFMPNGKYKGFFDKDNPDIDNGKYEVTADEETDKHYLNIEYKKNTVSYEIYMDNGNIILQYPGLSQPFILSTEISTVVSK